MAWYEIVIGAVLILVSLILIAIVLMQQSREAGLSGVIAGGADTFFGKNKSKTVDAKLSRITKILSVFFFVATLLVTYFFAYMMSKGGA